jgi:hypothetical protein
LLGVEEAMTESVVDEELNVAGIVEGQGYGTDRTFVPNVVDHQYVQSLVVEAEEVEVMDETLKVGETIDDGELELEGVAVETEGLRCGPGMVMTIFSLDDDDVDMAPTGVEQDSVTVVM